MFLIPESERMNVLQSQRLALEPITSDAAQMLLQIRTDPDTALVMGRKVPTEAEILSYIQRVREGMTMGKWLYWQLVSLETQSIVGTFCLWQLNAEMASGEIGYELVPSARGKGYVDEALMTILPLAHRLGLNLLEAAVSERNAHSIKVLKRLKFKPVGSFTEVDDFDEALKMMVYRKVIK